MTPPEIQRLTTGHAEALERLELAEAKSKRATRWIAGALITALATAGGSVGKHYLDLRENRRELDAVAGTAAAAEATADHRWTELDRALGGLRGELTECIKQAAINATAIDFLTADQRWIRRTATSRVEARPARAARAVDLADLHAPAEAVRRKKAEILDTLD